MKSKLPRFKLLIRIDWNVRRDILCESNKNGEDVDGIGGYSRKSFKSNKPVPQMQDASVSYNMMLTYTKFAIKPFVSRGVFMHKPQRRRTPRRNQIKVWCGKIAEPGIHTKVVKVLAHSV